MADLTTLLSKFLTGLYTGTATLPANVTIGAYDLTVDTDLLVVDASANTVTTSGAVGIGTSSLETGRALTISGNVGISGGSTTSFVAGAVGPDTGDHEGYATDGTLHYTIDTAAVRLRADDAGWTVTTENTDPFNGLAGGINHCGDSDYYNGKLYVPIENYTNPTTFSGQAIAVFNGTTLARESVTDISAQSHEAGGLAIDSTNGIIYVSSYGDGTKLWKYSLTDFSYLGALTLSFAPTSIQGIAYKSGYLYASTALGALGAIYQIDAATGATRLVYVAATGSNQGLKFKGTSLMWLFSIGAGDRKVKAFTPTTLGGVVTLPRLAIQTGTMTAQGPALDLNTVWNESSTIFTGLRLNVTNSASSSSSLPIDIRVNEASVYSVTPSGTTTVAGNVYAGGNQSIGFAGRSMISSSANGAFEFKANNKTDYATVTALGFNAATTQTTISGSVAGTAKWSMPMQGASFKVFVLTLNGLNDDGATVTYPTAFTIVPAILGDAAVVAKSSTDATTFTLAATGGVLTGNVVVIGY